MKITGALTAAVAAGTMLFAGSAGAAIGNVAPTVDPGIVDVNTNLGYQASSAAGTGIVLTPSGEVLTNNHVIRGATSVRVTDVGNGRTYNAKVVGYSVSGDIAVLQLQNASNLATVTLGDSAQVKPGDGVDAIGNAGGRGGTPASATGTISALGQSITASDGQGGEEQLTGLIKTNAGLIPGDSGGPLVDATGHVIGIDTAGSTSFQFQYGDGNSSAGGGYAIPIDKAISIARRITAGRGSSAIHVGPSPMMGVDIQSAASYEFGNFSRPASGAVVVEVLPSSPADRAGLVGGDTITSVDGRSIGSPTALTNLLLLKAPGDKISVRWIDQFGNSYTASVRLANGPPQ